MLRVAAAVLTALWAATGVIVLTAYRPGGRFDWAVGLVALLPALVAAVGVVCPPVAAGRRFLALLWLAIVSGLVLAPALAGVAGALSTGSSDVLVPSAETAYAFALALAGSAVFSGVGVARAVLAAAPGVRQAGAGIAGGLVVSALVSVAFAGVSFANDRSLLERVPSSAWGPTDPALSPPRCNGALTDARSAAVTFQAMARVDSTQVGELSATGARDDADERWTATITGPVAAGRHDYVRVGANAWRRDGDGRWELQQPPVPSPSLDTAVTRAALTASARATAEEVGLEVIGGARARHCRVAVDGPTALQALPTLRYFVAGNPFATDAALSVWRGELDWWVFADAQLGMIAVSIHGPAFSVSWGDDGFQATLEGRLTALERDQPHRVEPPGG